MLTKNKPGFFLLHASCLLALLIFIVGSMAQTLRTVLVTQKLITGTVTTGYSTARYEQRTIPSQQLVYQCGSLQGELHSRSFPYKTTTKLGATMYALA